MKNQFRHIGVIAVNCYVTLTSVCSCLNIRLPLRLGTQTHSQQITKVSLMEVVQDILGGKDWLLIDQLHQTKVCNAFHHSEGLLVWVPYIVIQSINSAATVVGVEVTHTHRQTEKYTCVCVCVLDFYYLFRTYFCENTDCVRTNNPHVKSGSGSKLALEPARWKGGNRDQRLVLKQHDLISEVLVKFRLG